PLRRTSRRPAHRLPRPPAGGRAASDLPLAGRPAGQAGVVPLGAGIVVADVSASLGRVAVVHALLPVAVERMPLLLLPGRPRILRTVARRSGPGGSAPGSGRWILAIVG